MKYIIKTRFNVGDFIWMMDGSTPHKAKVIGIRISGSDFNHKVDEFKSERFQYLLLGSPTSCYEHQAFATKKELVNSLLEEGDKE